MKGKAAENSGAELRKPVICPVSVPQKPAKPAVPPHQAERSRPAAGKAAAPVRPKEVLPPEKHAPSGTPNAATRTDTSPNKNEAPGHVKAIAVPPVKKNPDPARKLSEDDELLHLPSRESLIALAKDLWKDREKRRFLYLALVLAALLLFFLLPLFRIQQLESKERLYFTPWDEVVAQSGLREQQHFLRGYGGNPDAWITGRYSRAEKAVKEAFPALKKVEIRYQFPGHILFEIEERIPVAYMDIRDSYITLDRYGVVVHSTREMPRGLPVIRGIDALQMKVGEALLSNADEKLKSCIDVMSAIVEADFENQSQHPILPKVREIRAYSSRIVLELLPLGNEKLLTVTCSAKRNLKDDFLWLAKVLESGVLNDKLPGSLDIYGAQLVFRPDHVSSRGGDYVWQDEIWVPQEELSGEELPSEDVPEEEVLPEEIGLEDDSLGADVENP